MKFAICACQFYQRIPEAAIQVIYNSCRTAKVSCEIIPDLCLMAAHDSAALLRIADCDAIFACQPRAVRALLGNKTTVQCFDLHSIPLDEILNALSLPKPDTIEDTIEGIVYEKASKDWIPWFPVIDSERCVQCKKCVDFCMFGVYSVESNRVQVVRPERCKTDCPACARICPQNAIIFPKSEEDRLNGSLADPVKPSTSDNTAFRERLKQRKRPPLFREDEP